MKQSTGRPVVGREAGGAYGQGIKRARSVSRPRSSSLSLNSLTAAASADRSSGASTMLRYSARCRRKVTRQKRGSAAMLFFFEPFHLPGGEPRRLEGLSDGAPWPLSICGIPECLEGPSGQRAWTTGRSGSPQGEEE
jgi:hypothetical protein